MADQKLTALTALAALSADDLFYVVDDPAGAALSRKMAASVLDAKYLQAANNLSDLANVVTARGNLGLGSAAVQNSSAFATAAQGALADSSLQLADIGVIVQGYDADLATIAGLAKADGNFIVGDGAAWVVESGATARASLGLGTIATQAANSVSITGGSITGITDLAIADGGTGQSTAQAAIDALTNVAAATNEHVLTKDTATGNAIFKAAAGGSSLPVADTQTIVMGSADNTKLLRFEVDGFDGGATRVMTPPNQDTTLAGLSVAQTFTRGQVIDGTVNENQLIIEAHSTQTAPQVLFRASDGSELFRLHSNSNTNLFAGFQAGDAATADASNNIGLGWNSLGNLTTGDGNLAIGTGSLLFVSTGGDNVAVGSEALQLTNGDDNVAIGTFAFRTGTTMSYNVGIGRNAGHNVNGDGNTFIGAYAFGGTGGSPKENTIVGSSAGYDCTGDGNVFIGYDVAGTVTAVSNSLFIDNSNTLSPLIYGEFNNDLARINGRFQVYGLDDQIQAAVKAHSTQTNPLQEWQDNAGAYYTKIDKAGYFMTKKIAAPADADLATSEMAIWFDDTAGAAKLKIKAKDSGGTVRTGEVALA